jgi:kumamolisin
MAVDINQYLANNNHPTLGSASTLLYTLYNTPQAYLPYHDVTVGNNLFYPATLGYDLATGVGSPDVWNIARDLASLSSTGSGGVTLPTPPPLPILLRSPTPSRIPLAPHFNFVR